MPLKNEVDEDKWNKIMFASGFFTFVNTADYHLDALKEIAPKAYHAGKKPSKIFKDFCKALGLVDNTAGSQFQKLYAKIADELSAKKINFKLYVSINPAHFLTMSNPKHHAVILWLAVILSTARIMTTTTAVQVTRGTIILS